MQATQYTWGRLFSQCLACCAEKLGLALRFRDVAALVLLLREHVVGLLELPAADALLFGKVQPAGYVVVSRSLSSQHCVGRRLGETRPWQAAV